MKNFNFKIRGNNYHVEIGEIRDNILKIDVNGTQYKVEIENELKQSKTPVLKRVPVNTHKKIEKKERLTTHLIRTPLPGNIIQVLVKNGDVVKEGDKLLIYEAMKMENTVLADKDGKIQNLKVQAGDTVMQDEVLMEIV